MKTTPKILYISNSGTQGVFITTREEGARGQTLAQNAARRAAVWPRKRDKSRVSAVVLGRRARRHLLRVTRLSPCRLKLPVSSFEPLVLIESAL